MQVYFLTSETQLLHEQYVQTRCKDVSPRTRLVAEGKEKKKMTDMHKEGIKDDGKVSGGCLGKKFLPMLKKRFLWL